MIRTYDLRECKDIPLPVPVGYSVLVEMTTLAAYEVTVLVSGCAKQYFTCTRKSVDPLPIEGKLFVSEDDGMFLHIDIPESVRIDARVFIDELTDASGKLIVRTVNVIGEDGYDADYNDFIINFTIMRSAR